MPFSFTTCLKAPKHRVGAFSEGTDPLSPAYPTRAHLSWTWTGEDAPPPRRGRLGIGGTLSRSPQVPSSPFAISSARHRNSSPAEGYPSTAALPEFPFSALNLEFVAKPETARSAQSKLPGAIHSAFSSVTGFGGGFVFIANYEARLITVVTLWTGHNRAQLCEANLRWLRALIAPYLDRCLRVQTLSAVASTPGRLETELADPSARENFDRATLPEDAIYAA